MSTSVFLSHNDHSDLQALIPNWDYDPISFTGADEAWTLLSSEHPPEIFLFEWDGEYGEASLFLSTIWETRHEFPFYAIVYGDESKKEELTKFLGQGAHDFLITPFDQDILRAKLDVARQIVVDRRVLAESAQVMERYAKHVDRLSAERARQLFHAERLSTLGTMSAGLAHEIKNPLGYISTSLETTKIYWEQASQAIEDDRESSLDDTMKERILDRVPKALERISTGLQRIDKLMHGLKSFARSSQGDKRPYSLNACVETALEMCQTSVKYNIEVEKALLHDLPPVKIESQQVEQVLINLIVNASHALEETEEAKIYIDTFVEAEYIYLVVADNGPGIPRSKLDTIWQPYYTTKEEGKGTGLGLAISKSLIRDNGGQITVQNRDSGGAEFTLKFPLLDLSEEIEEI